MSRKHWNSLLAALLALAAACAPQERVIIRERVIYVERPPGDLRPPPPPPRDTPPPPPPPPPPPAQLSDVIDTARAHLGATTIVVKGTPFRYDCSNFVRGMFSALDVDLFALGTENPGANGVTLIFKYMERFGENHFRQMPTPGDVVYFDNTWDKNGNGRLDDPLTHVGIVESVETDGTIQILHRANRGIVRDAMNLLRPHDPRDENGKTLNGYLRPKARRDPPGTPYLMAETFAGFGTLKQLGVSGVRPEFLPLPGADEGEYDGVVAELDTLREAAFAGR